MDDCFSTVPGAQLFGSIFAVWPLACGDSPCVNVVDDITVTVPRYSGQWDSLVNPDPCLDLEVFNSKFPIRPVQL
ncbi:hypothetical protein DFJ58DRAFT_765674 [Suillus subalutaceus]|uniref:uncharacterized protein n=1 Tax=Suillus subalutaceus TaxID=48586 RepID=UPI001B85E4AF|nr:uncharacterized protein DFJ58DRAFT_765674 [Suillus subalutaceus]KAG1869373.1 hypothetical protein DFJ58DRAFT_765674 [Suillus subalutaceus]